MVLIRFVSYLWPLVEGVDLSYVCLNVNRYWWHRESVIPEDYHVFDVIPKMLEEIHG